MTAGSGSQTVLCWYGLIQKSVLSGTEARAAPRFKAAAPQDCPRIPTTERKER